MRNGASRKMSEPFYAYEVVVDPGRLEFADRLILHALDVNWACSELVRARSCSV